MVGRTATCLWPGRPKTRVCRDKIVFCRDKSMLAATKVLSRQNYVCRDKIFLSRQKFVVFLATSILLSRKKTCFVATKVFFRDNNMFFVTSILLSFVATNTWYLWQPPTNDMEDRRPTPGHCHAVGPCSVMLRDSGPQLTPQQKKATATTTGSNTNSSRPIGPSGKMTRWGSDA